MIYNRLLVLIFLFNPLLFLNGTYLTPAQNDSERRSPHFRLRNAQERLQAHERKQPYFDAVSSLEEFESPAYQEHLMRIASKHQSRYLHNLQKVLCRKYPVTVKTVDAAYHNSLSCSCAERPKKGYKLYRNSSSIFS
jgi:hypothetical protein